jgi:hypothetical protein
MNINKDGIITQCECTRHYTLCSLCMKQNELTVCKAQLSETQHALDCMTTTGGELQDLYDEAEAQLAASRSEVATSSHESGKWERLAMKQKAQLSEIIASADITGTIHIKTVQAILNKETE